MRPNEVWLILLAYVAGLLATAVPLRLDFVHLGGFLLLGLGVLAAALLPRMWRLGPRRQMWLVAGFVGLVAASYLQWRTPQPSPTDVSLLINANELVTATPVVTVRGRIDSAPRLTRSDRVQFFLEVQRLLEITGRTQVEPDSPGIVTGRLYVTVPLLQGTGLYPDQEVEVTGALYKPQPATYRGGFDFAIYLAQQGCFTGLGAYQVRPTANPTPAGWGWGLRQQLIRTQVAALGSPGGPLLSAIVLGSRGVDLPYDVRDHFALAGLAHTVAVSGFHVSLLLGFVLVLTRRLSARVQFLLGALTLLLLLGITGVQPSILRAVLMGLAALMALVLQRQVKPLGSLAAAAIVLLLINPLWIWDLGFQLSFLATFGLLTTVEPILKRLRWLPTVIAGAIAVPCAATLWTFPLQLYQFGLVSPYSIPANILSTLLVSWISIGGFISTALAAVWPAGSITFTRLTLNTPIKGLIGLVDTIIQLPGAGYATGKISLLQLLCLYGLLGSLFLLPKLRKVWGLVGIAMILIVMIPVWQVQQNRFQLTIFGMQEHPVMIIQNEGQVGLINAGDERFVQANLIPFLRQHGINHVKWAIATYSDPESQRGWLRALTHVNVGEFYEALPSPITEAASPNSLAPITSDSATPGLTATLAPSQAPGQASPFTPTLNQLIQPQVQRYLTLQTGQRLTLGDDSILEMGSRSNLLWSYRYKQTRWLWMLGANSSEQRLLLSTSPAPEAVDVLWWSGESLDQGFIEQIQPKVAIASSKNLDPDTLSLLRRRKIPAYWTGRDGAMQWNPGTGLLTTIEATGMDNWSF